MALWHDGATRVRHHNLLRPSVALHVFKVMASCSRCLLLAELQSSFRLGHSCLLGLLEAALLRQLSSVRVMFSHHDTDHRDVRVHFAKRQPVQNLCLSGRVKPNPQDRRLGLANQLLPYS